MKNDIVKIFSAEWLKLRRRRSTIVIPLFFGIFAVVMFLGLDLATRREWLGMPNGFYTAAAAIGWMADVAVLFAVIITGFHISGEFSMGTVKAAWVRPVSRRAWYDGKVLSAWSAAGVLFLLAVAIIVALSALRFGFTDLVEKEYLVHSAGSMGWRLVLTVVLSLWSLWAAVAVTAMLAAFLNRPGGAIAAGLVLGLILTALAVFPPARPYLLTTYVSQPSEQMTAMAKGLPLPHSWGRLVWQNLAGSGAWMILALVIGHIVIGKKEITF